MPLSGLAFEHRAVQQFLDDFLDGSSTQNAACMWNRLDLVDIRIDFEQFLRSLRKVECVRLQGLQGTCARRIQTLVICVTVSECT